jgi:putative protein-disulfide isomerase
MTENSLVYVGDPMCSWCYGFGVPLQQLLEQLPGVPLAVVLGGLRAYNQEVMPDTLKNTLHHHWEEVTKRSGKPFGTGQFDREGYIYDTEPACRAVVTIRSHAAEHTLAMYHAVQDTFYAEGRDITQTAVLADIWQEVREKLVDSKATGHAIDNVDFSRDAFIEAFESDTIKTQTRNDFAMVQQWGIRGFLALIAVVNGEAQLVANGYMEADEMLQRVQQVFEES